MDQPKDIPTISVVTPSFNQGRFLRQCIESVLSQTHSKFEIIIIDGGSTDETLSVIREYESRSVIGSANPIADKAMPSTKGFSDRQVRSLPG